MPWVRFSRAFDFRPTLQVWQTFSEGAEKLVTTPCAKAAVAAGAAKRIKPPPRTRED